MTPSSPASSPAPAPARPPRARLNPNLLLAAILFAAPTLLVGGLWWRSSAQDRRARELERQIEEQRARFEEEIARLLGETRRAQFRVTGQRVVDGVPHNKILFLEFLTEDDDTTHALRREFELPGAEVYIDAVLVQFDPQLVREGRARNFAVFRRAFTNRVSPDDGVALYDVSLREARQRAAATAEFARPADADLFVERLITYFDDAAAARRDGVRVIIGEAKYVNPRPGYFYEVIQQASGGLTIEEKAIPPILAPESPP